MTRLAAALAAVVLLAPVSAGVATAQGLGAVSSDPAAAPAGTYAIDKTHASVTMKVMHMGLSAYTLRFRTVDGSYTYDPRNPTASKLSVTIDPKSVDTGDAKFDAEIGNNFLGGASSPAITFVSTSVTPQDGGKGRVSGRLTLNGVTRPATLDVIYNGARKGMRGEDRMGFSALTTVRRTDFGVAKQLPTAVLGDDVNVLIEAEFKK